MARTTVPNELVAINAIQGTLIADNAVTAVHIATNAVSSTLIADNAVTTTHIAQNNVTNVSLASNAIGVIHIPDGLIDTTQLANNSITQAKIAAGALSDALAANSITAAMIPNDLIDSDHYAAASIDNEHLSASGTRNSGTFYRGDGTFAPFSAITSVGTLTSFRSTGIDDNADALAMTIDSSERVLVGQTSSSTPGNIGKLQVTGGIGLSGNSEIRNSTTSDDGSTIKFFGTQFVAGSNSQSYGYSEGGYIASLATAGSAILLDVGNTTANTGHRFRVTNAGNGIDGSIEYKDGTTSRFHVDSTTGVIKENDIPVRSRAIAMAMVFG